MGYIKRNLQKGENVVYTATVHWFLFFQPTVLILSGYFLYLTNASVAYWIGIILLFWGFVSLIQRIIIKLGSVHILTNKRLILKTGIFSSNQADLILTKCEGIFVRQSLIGKIFNFGTIVVTTGGVINAYNYIAAPLKFKLKIDEQIP